MYYARGQGPSMAWLKAHTDYQGNDCLPWPFARLRDGYGIGMHEQKCYRAHRAMCELVHGAPPTAEHEAAHTCGNGHLGCCNPKHLEWKTRKENRIDRVKHGRDKPRARWKLTPEQVAEIRSSNEKADVLAARFGVSRPNIYQVRTGKTWRTGGRTAGGFSVVPPQRRGSKLASAMRGDAT